MFFTITFELRESNTNDHHEIVDQIKLQINGLHWVKPMTNFFIINCRDERRRQNIQRFLFELSNNNYPNRLLFLISPLIDSGQYSGIAPSDLWDHINQITARDFNNFI